MADTNVKIKLTADGKQVRSELKLIDRELQELGGKEVKGKPKTKQQGEKSERDKANEARTNAKQESRDKVTESLYKEASLIRKELQKLNKSGVGGQSSGGSTTPPSSNGGDNGGSTPNVPSGGGSGDGGNGSKIASALGKLAMAGAAIKVLSSAINSLNSSAREAQAGESLAYKTYGSTLAYTDYNEARKDASNIGSPYGFDYETVMSAGKANMSKAGFTTLANYEADMTGILQTSKAWGIDTNNLGETSGFMSSIGVTKSGDQTRFANILAESIVDAQMTGREDEQLQVLEQIAESLASVNTTVSEKNVTDQLNLYNALVSQNENLKGSRGASLVESASDLARSGDTSLDILAGLNTEFTGKSGYIELRKMAEENPTEYWRRVVNGARQYGYDDEDIKYKLLKSSGLSTSQIDDLLSGIDNVENFKMEDTTEGEKATQERTENYQGSDAFTQEQYDIEKKEASDDRGNFWNDIKNPFRSLYNNAPDWAKQIFNGVDFGVKAGGTILGAKGLSSLAGKLFGGGSAASGGGGFVSSILGKFGFGSGAAAGGGISLAGLGAAAALVAVAPLLTSGGSYKHLTASGRASDANDWMDRYSAEMGKDNVSIDDKWEEVKNSSGVFYGKDGSGENGSYTKQDLQDRYNARQEMMDFYGSSVGQYYLYDEIQSHLKKGGKIDEDYLNGLFSWTSDKGVTYTGSQDDIEKILGDMYGGDFTDNFSRSFFGYSGRWNDDKISSWWEDYGKGWDSDDAKTNGYLYLGDKKTTDPSEYYKNLVQSARDEGYDDASIKQMIQQAGGLSSKEAQKVLDDNSETIISNTEALDSLTTEVSEMRKWLESNGYQGTAVWTDDTVKDTYEKEHSTTSGTDTGISNPLSNNKNVGTKWNFWNRIFGTSHATGNDYVPYDNYLASLHKGEMVLTSFEADQYRQGKVDKKDDGFGTSHALNLNLNITGAINGLTAENQNMITQAIIAELSQGGLNSMISNGFQRVQNY